MPVLNAVVAVIGVIALLNLVLTMGVIRRLREQAAMGTPQRQEQRLPTVGAAVGDFSTVDVHGRELSLGDLTGPAVVGFFTPSCAPCQALLPQFIAQVGALAEPGWHAVAVIVAEPGEDDAEYRQLLAPVARTVVETPHGALQHAFGAEAFPTIAVIDGHHTITASSFDAAALPGKQAVSAGT
jgi:thiol-disulfide isomerase/thioredoxin